MHRLFIFALVISALSVMNVHANPPGVMTVDAEPRVTEVIPPGDTPIFVQPGNPEAGHCLEFVGGTHNCSGQSGSCSANQPTNGHGAPCGEVMVFSGASPLVIQWASEGHGAENGTLIECITRQKCITQYDDELGRYICIDSYGITTFISDWYANTDAPCSSTIGIEELLP